MKFRWRADALLVLLAVLSGMAWGCGSARESNAPADKNQAGGLPEQISVDFPVSMAFAPDGRIFITEKGGSIRVVRNGALQSRPYLTVNVPDPPGAETGLLGIALDPNFRKSPFVYFYHTYERDGRLFNRVARVRDENGEAGRSQVILDRIPANVIHNGGVIGFGPDRNLYVMTGDSNRSDLAQNTRSLAGKTLRIRANGSIPPDNPFPDSPVFSLGHRNIFGMAFNPDTKRLYTTENGTDRDDEINIIRKGGNYGWPEVLGRSNDPRFINPIITFNPQVAPTQALFYRGDRFRDSRGDFFFGSFIEGTVHRLRLGGRNQDRVEKDDVVYRDPNGEGVIGIAEAPDGSLYVATESGITRVDRLER